MSVGVRSAVLALIATLLLPGFAMAAPPIKLAPIALPHLPGVVLVGFAPGADARERAAARARVGASARRISDLAPDAERWDLPRGLSTEAAMAALANNPTLRYVEPDWIVTASDTSDDPYYLDGTLWGMHGDGISPANQYGSGADEAWARGYLGSRDVYVGIIDTGVQYAHPDLADNFWTNAAEANGLAGVDDDANGKIDDLHGWDFYYNDAEVFDADEHYHGTHVAGTIGGIGGNGIGVAGVNWRVRMISGKFLGPSGSGSTDAAAAAVDYMTRLKTQNGLNIVATSNSWGGGGFSQTLLDAINRGGDAGILFIAAAGNGYADNDASANYPSNLQCTTRRDTGAPRGWDCLVAVAAIDSAGAKAGFSNWGLTTVDLGAPGVNVRSSYPLDSYAYLSGTSMATPHVSGAAALCASISPTLAASGIRTALLNSTTSTPSLAGLTVTGGRLDVGNLVDACLPPTAPVDGSVSGLTAGAPTPKALTLGWTSDSTNESGFEIQAATGVLGACGTFATVSIAGANSTSYVVGGLTASTDYCFRVRATNGYAGGSYGAWSNTASARTAAPPPAYVCTATTFAWIDPAGTAIAMSDDSYATVLLPAGFAFSAYGASSDRVTISSNGFLRLGAATGSYYSNLTIPATGEPNGVIAPAWDDWNPTAGGSISYQVVGTSPSRSFVVTWSGVPHYNVTGSAVTFQVILDEGGDVVRYQYLDMVTGSSAYDAAGSATIGVENATGEYGTQVSYNVKTATDASALRCTAAAVTPPAVVSAALPAGAVGAAYSASLAASGGSTPYAWSLASGALPAGLSLGSDGVISGIPSASGSASFTVRVTDSVSQVATGALSISIGAAPVVTTGSLPVVSAGGAYSTALAASGGSAPYTWSLDAGSLPAGLSLSASGTISGAASATGLYPITVRVTGANGGTSSAALSLSVVTPPAVGTSSLAAASVNSAYAETLAASGGATPYTWSLASGALPAGLALSAAGLIDGTPTASGTSSFSVRVTGSDGGSSTKALSISVATPPAFGTSTIAAGTAGASYSASISVSGGTTPYAWSAAGLPSGLSISAGRIAGTPTESGTFSPVVTVTDAAGRTASRTFVLTIGFGKASPAAGTKFTNTTRSVTLAWYPDAAGSYRWCASSSTRACSNWTSTSSTSATISVNANQTWNWQVQVLVGSTWTGANGGSGWKFSINR